MSWAHEWHPVAEDDLRRMHWREAARVDAAVQRLAESGQGGVEPVRGARNAWMTSLRMKSAPELPEHALVDPEGHVRCFIEGAVEDGDYAEIAALVR
jgi:hypothetical protein